MINFHQYILHTLLISLQHGFLNLLEIFNLFKCYYFIGISFNLFILFISKIIQIIKGLICNFSYLVATMPNFSSNMKILMCALLKKEHYRIYMILDKQLRNYTLIIIL